MDEKTTKHRHAISVLAEVAAEYEEMAELSAGCPGAVAQHMGTVKGLLESMQVLQEAGQSAAQED